MTVNNYYLIEGVCKLLAEAAQRKDIKAIEQLVVMLGIKVHGHSSNGNGNGNGNGNQLSLLDLSPSTNGFNNIKKKPELSVDQWKAKLKTQIIPHILVNHPDMKTIKMNHIRELLEMFPQKYPYIDIKGRLSSALLSLKEEGYLGKPEETRTGYVVTDRLLRLIESNKQIQQEDIA